ncbi:MAG: bifunctional (p)ppGpp synthetase/guanosine-3',5'-bis(diphosphate) 3'-pyrophosphohydrolase [bacterium]|nr:bifunctional (p)ppGpp synthetase/guanosine-3',5'-bis(diphosphate) 3'-pyrophosphohydrolase [bacterium]
MASTRTQGSTVPVATMPTAVEHLYRDLERKVRKLRPKENLRPLRDAYSFAAELHSQQQRKSGEPYMIHPLEVAHILADRQVDRVTLQTALLHDVVEDTDVNVDQLRKRFGEDVSRCVDGVTKLSKLNFYSREQRQAESVRKMLLAMVSDIRVVLVKLADRLHNMRTLGSLSKVQRERISHETIEIYAPIANRLGMGRIRGELEDLAFSYLEPQEYKQITSAIESKREANEGFLEGIRRTIDAKLANEGVPARVEGRVKRAYSVYQKIKRRKIPLDQVYDLLAVRIITDSVKNCYAALGVIHNEWHPIPGRIKDFIAIPRPNLYQSLHTSVIGPGGVSFEVQIRTDEMHRLSEEGIAAHWKYKEGRKGAGPDEQQIAWLRQLVEWQREMRDPGEFLSTLKVDLYPEEVYSFTPRGKVIALPRGATPIDFAYAIHSEVGHTCVGAKVNGRIVPLRYQIKNGDAVEILTQSGHQPSKDWLSLIKTSRARNKIRHVIKTAERVKAVEIGQKSLEKEARRMGVPLSRVGRADLERVAADYGCSKIEDLHAALGFGKYSARQVLQKVAPDRAPAEPVKPPEPPETKPKPRKKPSGDLVVQVKGLNDLMVYLSKCCNPIRGEPIVGYITRGKGVAVHSENCHNVQNLMYEVERKIDVEWTRSKDEVFSVKIQVFADDRPGVLNQLTSILFKENCNIRNLEAKSDTKGNADAALIGMTIEIRDKRQYQRVAAAMRRISGVRDIERVH